MSLPFCCTPPGATLGGSVRPQVKETQVTGMHLFGLSKDHKTKELPNQNLLQTRHLYWPPMERTFQKDDQLLTAGGALHHHIVNSFLRVPLTQSRHSRVGRAEYSKEDIETSRTSFSDPTKTKGAKDQQR